MDRRPSPTARTRRSEASTRRRSASGAPAILHLFPVLLFAILTLITLQFVRQLAAPMADQLANSWQPESDPVANNAHQTEVVKLAVFTPEVQRWSAEIETWSTQFALPPELIATVIQIESCGDPAAHSSAGAQGLFQVMPFHFKAGQDPLQVQVNAQAGLSYLKHSYQLADSDTRRTLAGYNGGHGVIHRAEADWPAETQRYVGWGQGILEDVSVDAVPSPTLARWLEAGGASLCRQAAQRTLVSR